MEYCRAPERAPVTSNTDSITAFQSMTREELLGALETFAKNWLAHDGCWFLAVEERLGMEAAIELDARAWARFAAAEATAHHDNIRRSAAWRPRFLGEGAWVTHVRAHQRTTYRVVRGPPATAFLHGCLPCAGSTSPQEPPRLPLQKCRQRRIRYVCPHHRSTNSYRLSALSARSCRGRILRLGIYSCRGGRKLIFTAARFILLAIARLGER